MNPSPRTNSFRFDFVLRALLIALVTLTLAACATSAKRLSNLRVGMTRSEVIANLGEPHSAEVRDGVEAMYFNLSVNRVAEGMFIGVMRPLNIGKRFYKVELVNGRVRSYYQTKKP